MDRTLAIEEKKIKGLDGGFPRDLDRSAKGRVNLKLHFPKLFHLFVLAGLDFRSIIRLTIWTIPSDRRLHDSSPSSHGLDHLPTEETTIVRPSQPKLLRRSRLKPGGSALGDIVRTAADVGG